MTTLQTYNQKKGRGFITAIILIIIALILLGYFKINIQSVINGPIVQDNLSYAWQIVVSTYNTLYNALAWFLQTYFHTSI